MSSQLTEMDQQLFALALRLARRGLGRVAPNPAVGCVIAHGGRIIARGWTQPGGRPHAEADALQRAAEIGADAARGATAYVTLEPCSHYGQTPPCCDALIAAGIRRVVVGPSDPDPRVSGRGFEKLKAAGVQVDHVQGRLLQEAQEVNQGFILRVTARRPMVTVKLATSLDGRLATHSGDSQWVTGPLAREEVHLARAEHDAILVGGRTAILDNPRLTVRLPGLTQYTPLRVVMDSHLRLPLTHKLVTTASEHPTVIFASETVEAHRAQVFKDAGVDVRLVPMAESVVSPVAVVQQLADLGITRVLIEGGGRLVASFFTRGLVDRLLWYRAPKLIGGDGVNAIASLSLDLMAEAITVMPVLHRTIGHDTLEEFVVTTPSGPQTAQAII